jgi:hypothetical protein
MDLFIWFVTLPIFVELRTMRVNRWRRKDPRLADRRMRLDSRAAGRASEGPLVVCQPYHLTPRSRCDRDTGLRRMRSCVIGFRLPTEKGSRRGAWTCARTDFAPKERLAAANEAGMLLTYKGTKISGADRPRLRAKRPASPSPHFPLRTFRRPGLQSPYLDSNERSRNISDDKEDGRIWQERRVQVSGSRAKRGTGTSLAPLQRTTASLPGASLSDSLRAGQRRSRENTDGRVYTRTHWRVSRSRR